MKLNLGCGGVQPEGWINTDSSLNMLVQRMPVIGKVVPKLLKKRTYDNANVTYMNVTKKWKFADDSVDVVYASHLFEHLTVAQGDFFLDEAYRVLKFQGIIRLVVPDLYRMTKIYIRDYENGHENPSAPLLHGLNLHRENMYGEKIRLPKKMLYEWQGYPHMHKYMYDSKSLSIRLKEHGFVNIQSMSWGVSGIESISDVENGNEPYISVYLEAQK